MYQTQLINLLREFSLVSSTHQNFHRLLHDADYRNLALKDAQSQNNGKVTLLVKQIQLFEDLLDHQLQVDVLPKTKQSGTKQRLGMAALAFSGLCFIAASVFIVEEVKHHRANSEIQPAD